jgi:hypothetical protein
MGMHGLPQDWVFRPAFDLELKHYTLLAYLQRVQRRFKERKLYPYLDEVEDHLKELLRMRDSKEELSRALSGDLLGFDPRTGFPIHAAIAQPEQLDVIDGVIDLALPGLRRTLNDGNDLREELMEKIRFGTVGVQPLRATEGWLMVRTGQEARV